MEDKLMPKGVYKRTKDPWNKGKTKETDERVAKNSESREKTMIERYGSTSYNNTEKREQTCVERYGVTNVAKVPEFMRDNAEKSKVTCLERYNCEHASQLDSVKEQIVQTFRANHNGMMPSQLPGVGDKISQRRGSKEVIQQAEETCLKRYNVRYVSQRPEFSSQIKATKLERYGDETYNNKEKEYETRRKNGTLGLFETKPEKELYSKLVSIYGVENVYKQHRTEEYPFKADLYVSTIDTYYELNGYFTHQDHPFDNTNEEDKKLVEQLIEEDTDWSRAILYQWTDLDVRKWQTAIDNNLNLCMIYTDKNGNDIVYSHVKT